MKDIANTTVLSIALLAACSSLTACGTTGWSEPKTFARGPQTVVYIEGRGVVTSSSLQIQCGPGLPTESSRCTGGTATPTELTAQPAAGWAFDHWDRQRLDVGRGPSVIWEGVDPAAGPTYAYTAVFVERPIEQTARR